MKFFAFILTVTGVVSLSAPQARSQWIVADPTAHAIAQHDSIQDFLKYLEMIQNQIEQINTLTAQLEELETYVERFGDPESIVDLGGIDSLLGSLNTEGVGINPEELRNAADGARALLYSAGGIYEEIPEESPSGNPVTRDPNRYRKFDAIHSSTASFDEVYKDVKTRRDQLKETIAETTQALQQSTTDAETQKLTGVLIAQSSELAAIDQELSFAAFTAMMRDIENRNDAERQQQARQEELTVDREEALSAIRKFIAPDTDTQLQFSRP